MNEVKQHQKEGSMWTVLKGRVYNLSPYMRFHPGGMDMILMCSNEFLILSLNVLTVTKFLMYLISMLCLVSLTIEKL